MANVTVNNGRGVVVPRDVVVERVQAVLARHPELSSLDPLADDYQRQVIRCKIDPGPSHMERDGWEGVVCEWHFGTYTMTDQETGELITLPSLALLTTDGRLCRLSNSEPAVRSWLTILTEIGVDRVREGLHVRVSLRASQTAGRHYWQILPC